MNKGAYDELRMLASQRQLAGYGQGQESIELAKPVTGGLGNGSQDN